MMLKYSFSMGEAHDRIFQSIKTVLSRGYRTGDIMTEGMTRVNTAEMGDLICKNL